MQGGTMRLLKVVAVLAALAAMMTVAVASARPSGPATPNFNLEAVLRPVAGGPDNAFGLVKFRQPKDADTIAYLGVWVRDLAPNHGYSLQRATDSTVNDDCVGTNWLTLGQGLTPQGVTTDGRGTGRADLFRNLAAIPLGTELDIHFRVIDATTSAVVLA
ncbi:MAG: hypothetical protein ACXVRS_06410, partial [Gaiellaceae bacterium]